jgi:rhodanese-related sulfurtransferase
MIRTLSQQRLLEKIDRHTDSQFSVPAGDHLAVIEVGPAEEFDRIHIAKAIHLPSGMSGPLAAYFPDRAIELVLYSDQAHQAMLDETAQKLTSEGFGNLYLLEGGKEAWLSQELPVQSSEVPADRAELRKFY